MPVGGAVRGFVAVSTIKSAAALLSVRTEGTCDEVVERRTCASLQLFFGNDHSQINMLFIFWSPVFYLVHPEARDSKFKEHAKPAVYYGPSRDTDSERYCQGHRRNPRGHAVARC